jgi:hypothetical protein
MKCVGLKSKLLLICILMTQIGWSQQVEFGPNFNYAATDIANSKVTKGRAVIGSSLWTIREGFSVIFYFKNPKVRATNGIHFEYAFGKRGTKSDNYPGNEYSFDTKSFNLCYRRAGSLGDNFGIYADLGFGYNVLDNEKIYKGTVDELVAFDRLREPLLIKNNEISFLYGLGVDKQFFKDRLVVCLGFNGDAGITEINQNAGSFRTQSLGFTAGLRYLVKLKKQKKRFDTSQ